EEPTELEGGVTGHVAARVHVDERAETRDGALDVAQLPEEARGAEERVVGEARGGILLGERVVVRDGLLGLARRGVARGDAEAGGRHGLARVAALDHALEDGLLVDAAAELGRGLRLDEAGGAAELAAGTDGRAARPRMRELEALGAHEALRF